VRRAGVGAGVGADPPRERPVGAGARLRPRTPPPELEPARPAGFLPVLRAGDAGGDAALRVVLRHGRSLFLCALDRLAGGAVHRQPDPGGLHEIPFLPRRRTAAGGGTGGERCY